MVAGGEARAVRTAQGPLRDDARVAGLGVERVKAGAQPGGHSVGARVAHRVGMQLDY